METSDFRGRRGVAAITTCVALIGSALTATATAAPASPVAATSRAPAAVAATSAVFALPAGPVPQGVPYGIGKRLYLNGQVRDFAPIWGSLTQRDPDSKPEFGDLAITRGVTIWSINYLAADPYAHFGSYVPGRTPTRFGVVENYPGFATTTGGLVAPGLSTVAGGSAPIYTTSGKVYPPTYQSKYGLPTSVTFQSVGGMFVFQDTDQSVRDESYRYYPGYAPVRIPDFTYGVGTGWVATRQGESCYRTAPLMSPTALRARICSQVLPMLNDAGTKAVVVQGNHVRLYDTRTGAQIHATNAPTLSRWDFTVKQGTAYGLVKWLDANTYLVNVRDGTALALLRCSAITRGCERAVTSSVRSGVSNIVS